jgi:hypothetical protein
MTTLSVIPFLLVAGACSDNGELAQSGPASSGSGATAGPGAGGNGGAIPEGGASAGGSGGAGDCTNSREVEAWFRESFDANPPMYGFGYVYPEAGNFVLSHLPTGSWDGSGAAHLRFLAGHTQYGVGWATTSLGHAFAMGDGVYIRFRIRYDDDQRWETNGNKLILMGNSGAPPNSRIIFHDRPPSDSSICTLGQVDYGGTGMPFPWGTTAHFGLPNDSWSDAEIAGLYGGLSPAVNISWDCGPPSLVTHGNHANAPAPGPNSAPPVDGWYHFQFYAESGNPGQGAFKTWANNNQFAAPTAERSGLDEGLGVEAWSEGAVLGGYIDGPPAQDSGYAVDDFEIGPTFDPCWAP